MSDHPDDALSAIPPEPDDADEALEPEEVDDDHADIAAAFQPFVPILGQLLDNQSRALAIQERDGRRRSDLHTRTMAHREHTASLEHQQFERRMTSEDRRFTMSFWLLVGVAASVVALAFGLVFVRGDVETGLQVLTYLGAVTAGAIAGMGYQKARDERKQ